MRETALHFLGLDTTEGEEDRELNLVCSLVAEAYDGLRTKTVTPDVSKLNVIYEADRSGALRGPEGSLPTGRDADTIAELRMPWNPPDLPPARPPELRRRFCLERLHAGCVAYVTQRGWDRSPFDRAAAALQENGIRDVWQGPWKTERSTRHRARACGEVTEDGAFVWVEIVDRDGREVLSSQPQRLDLAMIGEVRRRAAAVSWQGPGEVRVRARSRSGLYEYPDLVVHL